MYFAVTNPIFSLHGSKKEQTIIMSSCKSNDVIIDLRDLDPELAYEASLATDFSAAAPEVKLAWIYLMCFSDEDTSKL